MTGRRAPQHDPAGLRARSGGRERPPGAVGTARESKGVGCLRPGAVTRETESSRWALSAPSPPPRRGKNSPLPAGSSAKIPFRRAGGEKWMATPAQRSM